MVFSLLVQAFALIFLHVTDTHCGATAPLRSGQAELAQWGRGGGNKRTDSQGGRERACGDAGTAVLLMPLLHAPSPAHAPRSRPSSRHPPCRRRNAQSPSRL